MRSLKAPESNQKGTKMPNRTQWTWILMHQGCQKCPTQTAPAKHCAKSYPSRNPEPQLRMNSSDIDKIVMPISSLNFTINEACESKQKSHENKQRAHESELKALKELHDSTKTQVVEAHKCKDTVRFLYVLFRDMYL